MVTWGEGVYPFSPTIHDPIEAMKKLLTIALCALFAIHAAEARTLYVDATRPNNKGNGLKAKTAKKTIQAAINIARNGDTIIVYPGKYSNISTKNKKIRIISKSGKSKTNITNTKFCDESLFDGGSGVNSKMSGFTFAAEYMHATKGGTFANCDFKGVGNGINSDLYGKPQATFYKSSFADCLFSSCYACTMGMGGLFLKSSLNRCIIEGSLPSYQSKCAISSSTLYNCLLADNEEGLPIIGCTLVNCTIADNMGVSLSKNKAYNTIFYKVATSQFKKSKKNVFKKCYKGKDPKFVSRKTTKKTWVADGNGYDSRIVGAEVSWSFNDGVDWQDGDVTVAGTTDAEIFAAAKAEVGLPDAEYNIDSYNYEYGNYVNAVIPSAYRLQKRSPCINKGKLTKSQKKEIGKKDLDGRKRIRKAVDIGCYEY
jgi:hypothetical protein